MMSKLFLLAFASLFLQNCSSGVPAVGSLTIQNKTEFPVITEFKMSDLDGNKSGSAKTKANKSENHDWTYGRKAWEESHGDKEETIKFFLEGQFFSYTLDRPLEELTSLQWQTPGFLLNGVQLDEFDFQDLPNVSEKIEALHQQDERIIVSQIQDMPAKIFIANVENAESMQLLLPNIKTGQAEFVEMLPTEDILISFLQGSNVIQKTFTCKISGCREKN